MGSLFCLSIATSLGRPARALLAGSTRAGGRPELVAQIGSRRSTTPTPRPGATAT